MPVIEQWVNRVRSFSSQYDSNVWAAYQIIGPPKVSHSMEKKLPHYGDRHGSWVQSQPGANEFIELEFVEAVYISQLEIYETLNGGAIHRISALSRNGFWIVIWTGQITRLTSSRIFKPMLKECPFATNVIKLELDCTTAGTWCEIDAVKLIGIKADKVTEDQPERREEAIVISGGNIPKAMPTTNFSPPPREEAAAATIIAHATDNKATLDEIQMLDTTAQLNSTLFPITATQPRIPPTPKTVPSPSPTTYRLSSPLRHSDQPEYMKVANVISGGNIPKAIPTPNFSPPPREEAAATTIIAHATDNKATLDDIQMLDATAPLNSTLFAITPIQPRIPPTPKTVPSPSPSTYRLSSPLRHSDQPEYMKVANVISGGNIPKAILTPNFSPPPREEAAATTIIAHATDNKATLDDIQMLDATAPLNSTLFPITPTQPRIPPTPKTVPIPSPSTYRSLSPLQHSDQPEHMEKAIVISGGNIPKAIPMPNFSPPPRVEAAATTIITHATDNKATLDDIQMLDTTAPLNSTLFPITPTQPQIPPTSKIIPSPSPSTYRLSSPLQHSNSVRRSYFLRSRTSHLGLIRRENGSKYSFRIAKNKTKKTHEKAVLQIPLTQSRWRVR